MSIKILVVDDSQTDREIIKSMLVGYNVLLAIDGIDALRVIDSHPDIGLVVLDLNMPNMNGFEVLEALASDERYSKLRTLILTNFDELDNEINGLKLGAVDYIRKPIHMDSLKTRIDIHLELIRVQREMEERLQAQEMTLDAISKHMPTGMAIALSKGPMTEELNETFGISPAFEEVTGRTKEELLRVDWAEITHSEDAERISTNYERLQAGEINSFAADTRLIRPDGSIIWVRLFVSLLYSDRDEFIHITFIEDVTERKMIEQELIESERSKSVLLANLPGLAYRCNYDADWTMKFVSTGCYELIGYPAEDLVDNKRLSFNDVILPEYRKRLRDEWERVVAERSSFRYEYEIRTATGEHKWVLEMGQASYDGSGEIDALEGIILDISDRKEIEDNLRYVNTHDSSTGLHNRAYLETLLESDAKHRNTTKRALVGINLNMVQFIEAHYGFSYAEELIKKAVETLSQYCNGVNCQLFRTYETRLVFYLTDYKNQNELIEFSEVIAEKLDKLLAADRVGGGIGILEIGDEEEIDADLALGKVLIASERSISIFDKEFRPRFYDQDLEALVNRENEVMQELSRVAVSDDAEELFLQYQPILDLKTNSIHGFEALARLKSDKLGLVSPMEFIPLAEKSKLIIPIGEKVMIKAFRFLQRLKGQGYDKIHVTINISAIQLLRPGFAARLLELVDEMDVDPHKVGLEITETIFASNYEQINHIITELRDAGFYIAIDDFGIGYSSMSRLKQLNVNCLKIDKYFIDHLIEADDRALTGDIISMGQRLGHFVIAEGVERREQKQYLLANGCDMIQGYLVSRPLDEEAAMELLS